jgi:predicted  nucleic acid-binding Zn-ribbon protein
MKEGTVMNKIGRKQLAKITARLFAVKESVLDIKSDLEYVCDDEQNTLDNMEKFSGTDRYAAIEEAAEHINDALDSLEEVIENIDNAVTSVNEASM